MESGWLKRELSEAAKEVKQWPAWLRQEAGFDHKQTIRVRSEEEPSSPASQSTNMEGANQEAETAE